MNMVDYINKALIKEAISAKLVAKTLASGLRRNVEPERLNKFMNRIKSWAPASVVSHLNNLYTTGNKYPLKQELLGGAKEDKIPLPAAQMDQARGELLKERAKKPLAGMNNFYRSILDSSNEIVTSRLQRDQINKVNKNFGTNLNDISTTPGIIGMGSSMYARIGNHRSVSTIPNTLTAGHELGHAIDDINDNMVNRTAAHSDQSKRIEFLNEQIANRHMRNNRSKIVETLGNTPELPEMRKIQKVQQEGGYKVPALLQFLSDNTDNIRNRGLNINPKSQPAFLRPLIRESTQKVE